MIYKTEWSTEGGSSGGFHYSSSKAETIRWLRNSAFSDCRLRGHYPHYTYISSYAEDAWDAQGDDTITVTTYATPRSKAAWIAFLNDHAAHADNG
jgi:hypothetical protein